ncbi:glycosyltransferase family A protein [Nonomuraea ferruginea]
MRVRNNDYRPIRPAADFEPELRVSVVIPAYGAQDKLDLVLAGLARQTYPAGLTEVIVVDNGSDPPLRLPADCPPDTRLIRCETPGRGSARNAGLAEATGDVIHWLDSDVVPTAGAITAHMRWHHAAPYLAVTGYIRFSESPLPEKLPDDLEAYFELAEPHAWIVRLVERTDGLTDNGERPFSLHVGGATSVSARLIEAAGPMDGDLVLGQDTEMGYRLMQAGGRVRARTGSPRLPSRTHHADAPQGAHRPGQLRVHRRPHPRLPLAAPPSGPHVEDPVPGGPGRRDRRVRHRARHRGRPAGGHGARPARGARRALGHARTRPPRPAPGPEPGAGAGPRALRVREPGAAGRRRPRRPGRAVRAAAAARLGARRGLRGRAARTGAHRRARADQHPARRDAGRGGVRPARTRGVLRQGTPARRSRRGPRRRGGRGVRHRLGVR